MEETEKMFRTGFVDYGISLDAFVEMGYFSVLHTMILRYAAKSWLFQETS